MADTAFIVEDDGAVLTMVGGVLQGLGLAVESAGTAEAAVDWLAPDRLALVVSALRVPGQGGLFLLGRAKQVDPALPVVLMAAYGDVESPVEALKLGADDFLMKPLVEAELEHVFRRAIEKGRLLRESRRQRGQIEELRRTKTLFLASMSHELRTPLTTVIGMSEVLCDQILGPLNPKQKRYAGCIAESATHLLALINDILDYAKVEAGKMTLNAGQFVAGDAIAAACSIARGHALRKGIRIEVDGANAETMRADRQKVVQVLVNLLANAIRYSPDGSVVRVGLTVGARDVRFAVSDRGAGIPREALDRIFEEFAQVPPAAGVDGTGTGTGTGTGLGLALSRQLARLHGGDIQVESVFGMGSTFTLILPRSILPDLALAV